MSPGPSKQGTIQGEIDKVGEVTARSSIRITVQYSHSHTTLTLHIRQQQHFNLQNSEFMSWMDFMFHRQVHKWEETEVARSPLLQAA